MYMDLHKNSTLQHANYGDNALQKPTIRNTLYLPGKIIAIAQLSSRLQRVSRSKPQTGGREYKDRYTYHGSLCTTENSFKRHMYRTSQGRSKYTSRGSIEGHKNKPSKPPTRAEAVSTRGSLTLCQF